MKRFIASVICLLVGLAAGFFVGYRYYERHITNEAVKLMVDGMESSAGVQAGRDIRAIQMIQSGEITNAVQTLSYPIADYYYLFAIHANTDREHKMRAMIEELISTNKIVADEMTNQMVNYEIHEKLP